MATGALPRVSVARRKAGLPARTRSKPNPGRSRDSSQCSAPAPRTSIGQPATGSMLAVFFLSLPLVAKTTRPSTNANSV